MQNMYKRSPFVSELLPAYTKVATHSVVPVHQIIKMNLYPMKQQPIQLAYFSNWKRNAVTKVNLTVLFYVMNFFMLLLA
jgi:hypothetical protein